MQRKVTGPGGQAPEPEQRQADPAAEGSGQGAAAALARLQSQREHHARHQPADDAPLVGRRAGNPPVV